MNSEKRIIGIDVFRNRYDACFIEINSKAKKYYTGSLINDYGKDRLIKRFESDDLIIINDCVLAAYLLVNFKNRVIVVENKIVALLVKANISRGVKMAGFFVENFENKKNGYLSKEMKQNLLNEESNLLKSQEELFDKGLNLFDLINDGKNIESGSINELEEKLNNFTNQYGGDNKINEIEKAIVRFEELQKLFRE